MYNKAHVFLKCLHLSLFLVNGAHLKHEITSQPLEKIVSASFKFDLK